MLISQIGLVSRSKSVDFPALARVAAALNLQIARDVAPIWPVAVVVLPVPDADRLDPGVWPIYVVDEIDEDGAGFHLTRHNQPFAQVKAGHTWSLTASHEAIEMAIDPSGNRLVAAPAIRIVNTETADTAAIVEYLLEPCGPSVDPSCAYLIDGVLVADFHTPHFFDPTGSAGARYSFSGRITRPRQILPNGSLTWFDPASNKLRRLQNLGAPEIVELASVRPGHDSMTDGLSLRAFVDRRGVSSISLSVLPPADRALQRREGRTTALASATPSRATLFAAGLKSSTPPIVESETGRRARDVPVPGTSQATTGDRRKNVSYEKVHAAILTHAAALTLPGILSVRPGLHFGAEGFTNERVVVVKSKPNAVDGLMKDIPPNFGDIRVEVRAADALERFRVRNSATYLQVAAARHELRAPVFEDALYLDGSGTTVDDATVAAAAMNAQVTKRQVEYTPPKDLSLEPITDTFTLVLHVSPDAGWSELSKFLSTNTGDLVVGMHDFTSAHVLQAIECATQGSKLMLTLDRPAPTPSADQSTDATRHELSRKLGRRFSGAWALTNADPKAPIWIYPSAYHAKVAVRADGGVWLSSADWNNGNLPCIDLADEAAARKIAATSDRDWHVIVTHEALADTFRAVLAHDHAIASSEEGKAAAASGAAPVGSTALPVVPTEAFTTGKPPKQFFAAKTITVRASVQPLLTPDNYQPQMKALVESAAKSFYMQTQYIHPSGKRNDEGFDALIIAVRRLIDSGIDVRLITSTYQTDDWMEKLVMCGIPSTVLRRQPGVHNNGIIVDQKSVLVGSHSWSADGALRNREAGLIIHDETAAAYFEKVFLHDWEHLAVPVVC